MIATVNPFDMWERRNTCTILVGERHRKRSRHKWENGVKIYPREVVSVKWNIDQ
jgi:hypothetical protein